MRRCRHSLLISPFSCRSSFSCAVRNDVSTRYATVSKPQKQSSAVEVKPYLNRSRCKHLRRKYLCKECAAEHHWCSHGLLRARCLQCSPSVHRSDIQQKLKKKELCEHRQRLHYCLACGGRRICQHRQVMVDCPQCWCVELDAKGCRHELRLDLCLICGGHGLCHHWRPLKKCTVCPREKRRSSKECPHGQRRRSRCLLCKPKEGCKHISNRLRCEFCKNTPLVCGCGVRRVECTKLCPHPLLCEHGKMQYQCGTCRWCQHDERLANCNICSRRQYYCIHGKRRLMCSHVSCSGCEHGKLRRNCLRCFRLCRHGVLGCDECIQRQRDEAASRTRIRRQNLCPHNAPKDQCPSCSRRRRKVDDADVSVNSLMSSHLVCSHLKSTLTCPTCSLCCHHVKRADCIICSAPFRNFLQSAAVTN